MLVENLTVHVHTDTDTSTDIAVIGSEANEGYSGVKGVLDVQADGGGAGSHLVGGVEVVPVGRHIDIARALGGSEVDVVDGGNGGDAFLYSTTTSDGTNTTTHADADTIHIDTSTDTVHTQHTAHHTSGEIRMTGGTLR